MSDPSPDPILSAIRERVDAARAARVAQHGVFTHHKGNRDLAAWLSLYAFQDIAYLLGALEVQTQDTPGAVLAAAPNPKEAE